MNLLEANFLGATVLASLGFGALAVATRTAVALYHRSFLLFWAIAWSGTTLGWVAEVKDAFSWLSLVLDVVQMFCLYFAAYALHRADDFAWSDHGFTTMFALLPIAMLLVMLNGVLVSESHTLWRFCYLGLHAAASIIVMLWIGWTLFVELGRQQMVFVGVTVFAIFILYAFFQIPDYMLLILDPKNQSPERTLLRTFFVTFKFILISSFIVIAISFYSSLVTPRVIKNTQTTLTVANILTLLAIVAYRFNEIMMILAE